MGTKANTRLSGLEAMEFLEKFYSDNQNEIGRFGIKTFDDFIKCIFMTLDCRIEYDVEKFPDNLEQSLKELGVVFVESDVKDDLYEDRWYETVFSVCGKFFKSGWSVYESSPWPKMGIRHDIIKENIKEVFPVERTIIAYE